MAELHDQVSQYIGFKPNEIRLPITKEDRLLFSKIIADQEGIVADIVTGDRIHIGWLFPFTMAQAKKVLINPPKDLSEKILAHIEKRFREVPLAPVLIR